MTARLTDVPFRSIAVKQASALIDLIYETAANPDRWPTTLQLLADAHNCVGANLIKQNQQGVSFVSSQGVAETTFEFSNLTFNAPNTRVTRLIDRYPHPGFLTDSHLHTPQELATFPIYAEFLNPRGFGAGAASIIDGSANDALIVAVEGFADHPSSRKAIPSLNRLRPHLARALAVSSQIETVRATSILDAFDAYGTSIALLDREGRCLGANAHFRETGEKLIHKFDGQISMYDAQSDNRFRESLAKLHAEGKGSSIALRDATKFGAAVMHIVPVPSKPAGLFTGVEAYAILTAPTNDQLPASNIISALFDLTPAEARVARLVATGKSVTKVARELRISPETVRSQLKRVFHKASVCSQNELTALLTAFR